MFPKLIKILKGVVKMVFKEDDRWYERKCTVCNREDVASINEDLLSSNYTQRDIANKYGLNESSLSIHKRRHLINRKERLQDIIDQALDSSKIEPQNLGDLVRILEYSEKHQNDEILNQKKTWDNEKKKMFDRFKNTINYPLMFDDLSQDYKDTIINIAELCFVKEEMDMTHFLRAYMNIKDNPVT